MTQLLYTVTQACEALAIGRTQLYELINKELIETVKIGKSRRISREALETFIASLPTN